MEQRLSLITSILLRDEILPTTKFTPFRHALGVRMSEINSNATHYDAIFCILQKWISKKGTEATLESLIQCLRTLELKSLEDQIDTDLIQRGHDPKKPLQSFTEKDHLSTSQTRSPRASQVHDKKETELVWYGFGHNIVPKSVDCLYFSEKYEILTEFFKTETKFNNPFFITGEAAIPFVQGFAVALSENNYHCIEICDNHPTALQTNFENFCKAKLIPSPTTEQLGVGSLASQLSERLKLYPWLIIFTNVQADSLTYLQLLFDEFRFLTPRRGEIHSCPYVIVTGSESLGNLDDAKHWKTFDSTIQMFVHLEKHFNGLFPLALYKGIPFSENVGVKCTCILVILITRCFQNGAVDVDYFVYFWNRFSLLMLHEEYKKCCTDEFLVNILNEFVSHGKIKKNGKVVTFTEEWMRYLDDMLKSGEFRFVCDSIAVPWGQSEVLQVGIKVILDKYPIIPRTLHLISEQDVKKFLEFWNDITNITVLKKVDAESFVLTLDSFISHYSEKEGADNYSKEDHDTEIKLAEIIVKFCKLVLRDGHETTKRYEGVLKGLVKSDKVWE